MKLHRFWLFIPQNLLKWALHSSLMIEIWFHRRIWSKVWHRFFCNSLRIHSLMLRYHSALKSRYILWKSVLYLSNNHLLNVILMMIFISFIRFNILRNPLWFNDHLLNYLLRLPLLTKVGFSFLSDIFAQIVRVNFFCRIMFLYKFGLLIRWILGIL